MWLYRLNFGEIEYGREGSMSDHELSGQEAPEESVRISGRVKWFDAGKGYGFIVPDDHSQTGARDILLHVTSLRNAGRESAAVLRAKNESGFLHAGYHNHAVRVLQ